MTVQVNIGITYVIVLEVHLYILIQSRRKNSKGIQNMYENKSKFLCCCSQTILGFKNKSNISFLLTKFRISININNLIYNSLKKLFLISLVEIYNP